MQLQRRAAKHGARSVRPHHVVTALFAIALATGCGGDVEPAGAGGLGGASGFGGASGSGGVFASGGAPAAGAGGVVSGGAAGSPGAGGGSGACPALESPAERGKLQPTDITEASGLAASRKNPGILYVHNDSGDTARGFAITETGELVARLHLAGALAVDWEDIAVGKGPEPDESYIYFADIGDNNSVRSGVTVYRVLEPALGLQDRDQSINVDYDALNFRYPDGAHDAETIFSDPTTADLYFVTKRDLDGAKVFRAPAPHASDETTTLQAVATVDAEVTSWITGGDIAPDGSMIVVRTMNDVISWTRPDGGSVAETLASPWCRFPVAAEIQGEAIGFAADGSAYFTVSEGVGAIIWRVRLR